MAEFIFLNPYWLIGLIVIPIGLTLNNKFAAKKSALIAPHLAKILMHSGQSKALLYCLGNRMGPGLYCTGRTKLAI